MNIIHEIGNEPQRGHAGEMDKRTDGWIETNIHPPPKQINTQSINNDWLNFKNFQQIVLYNADVKTTSTNLLLFLRM